MLDNLIVYSRNNGRLEFDDQSVHQNFKALTLEECQALGVYDFVWINHEVSEKQYAYVKVQITSIEFPRPKFADIRFQGGGVFADFNNNASLKVYKMTNLSRISDLVNSKPDLYRAH